MQYVIRLNKKAFNPITHDVIAARLWEVEQCLAIGGNGRIDSEPVIWHCAEIRVDGKPIRELFQLPKPGDPPWQMDVSGVCVRGSDDAIEIRTEK